jgi:hypothetical protein
VLNGLAVMLPLAIWRQENSTHGLPPELMSPKHSRAVLPLRWNDPLALHSLFWTVIQFLGSFLYWSGTYVGRLTACATANASLVLCGGRFRFGLLCSVGSNLFAIAFAEYRMLGSKTDSWKLYIGGTLGFIIGFASYKW